MLPQGYGKRKGKAARGAWRGGARMRYARVLRLRTVFFARLPVKMQWIMFHVHVEYELPTALLSRVVCFIAQVILGQRLKTENQYSAMRRAFCLLPFPPAAGATTAVGGAAGRQRCNREGLEWKNEYHHNINVQMSQEYSGVCRLLLGMLGQTQVMTRIEGF